MFYVNICGKYKKYFHVMLKKRYIYFCLREMFYKYLFGLFILCIQLALAYLWVFLVWTTSHLARVAYWSHSQTLHWGSAVVMFILWTWVPLWLLTDVLNFNILVDLSFDENITHCSSLSLWISFGLYIHLFLVSFCLEYPFS